MYEGACWKTTRYLWGDCMVWQIYMDGLYYRLYWPVIWVTLSQAKLYLAGWDEKWKKLKEMSDMKCVRTGIHQTWKWYDMSVIKCKNVWSCKMYGLYGRCVNITSFSHVMRDALRMKPVFGSVLVRVREKPQKNGQGEKWHVPELCNWNRC